MNKFDLEPLTSSKNDGSGEVEDSYSEDEDYEVGSSYDDKDNRSNESGDEYTADDVTIYLIGLKANGPVGRWHIVIVLGVVLMFSY